MLESLALKLLIFTYVAITVDGGVQFDFYGRTFYYESGELVAHATHYLNRFTI